MLRLLAFVALLAVCHAGNVLELDQDSYEGFVTSSKYALVTFTSPWCNNCKQLVSDMETASRSLPGVKMGTMAQEKTGDWIKDTLGIEGYPAVKFYENGDPTPQMYRGPRDSEGMVYYLNSFARPLPAEYTDLEELQKVMKHPKATFVSVLFTKNKETKAYRKVSKLLKKYNFRADFLFAVVFGDSKAPDSMFKALGADRAKDSVAVFKTWTDDVARYSGPWKTKKLRNFLRSNSYPNFAEFGPVWAKYMNGRNMPIARVIFDYDGSTAQAKYDHIRAVVDKVAPEFSNDVVFATQPRSRMLGWLKKVSAEDKEVVIHLSQYGSKDSFVFEYEWNVDTVRAWLKDYKRGRLDPWVKSEPVPKKQDGHVVTVVGKTFKKIVHDRNKDVMIEFYAPWCGHCKKLTPIYEKLARKFRKIDSVVIAKMDATANEWDRDLFKVTGFPTIFFVTGGSGQAKAYKYQYGRDVRSMKRFIKEHAGIPFKWPKKNKKKKNKNSK